MLSARILKLVQYYTNGNVKAFAEKLSNISQQRLDRIFKIDKRTAKYPSVPDDILVEISKCCPEINLQWLLSGKGEMLNNQPIVQEPPAEYYNVISEKDKIIEWLNRELEDKREMNRHLQDVNNHLIKEIDKNSEEIKSLKSELSMLKEELKKKEPSLEK